MLLFVFFKYALIRSSSQTTKPVKMPVTPSTATLSKSQKNKTKKKPVEKKASKQSSPVKNTSPVNAIPSPQVSGVYNVAIIIVIIMIMIIIMVKRTLFTMQEQINTYFTKKKKLLKDDSL